MSNIFTMKKFEELRQFKLGDQPPLRVIGSSLGAKHIAMSMVILKPGEKLHEHTHEKAEEIYVLAKGKSRMIVAGKSIDAEAVTTFWFPADTKRGVVNDSKEDAVWYFVGAPIDEYRETYEEYR